MGDFAAIGRAADAIRQRCPLEPQVGVILGSGLGNVADGLADPVVIPYGEIPGFAESTVSGHHGALLIGRSGDVPVAIMKGRVHYYEGHPMEQVTFPVRVLRALGIRRLIITNAAGATNPDFVPGDLMLITDHLNLTGHNPLRGPNDDRLGPRFPDMSSTYRGPGERAIRDAAQRLGIPVREGVYAGLAGPSYETPAEIRMLQVLGADAVGMSTVAEVIVAAHGGMAVAGISVITNRAAGLSTTPLSHEEVKEVGQRVEESLGGLMVEVVKEFAGADVDHDD